MSGPERRGANGLTVYELLGPARAVKAAKNFRALRRRGVTVRKTADTVIATFCIEKRLPLLYRDRDFDPFVEHFGLRAAFLFAAEAAPAKGEARVPGHMRSRRALKRG